MKEFCLGPTHEEIFTETVKNEIRSYRALPLLFIKSRQNTGMKEDQDLE